MHWKEDIFKIEYGAYAHSRNSDPTKKLVHCILQCVNITLRRFRHNYDNIATEGGPTSRDYALYCTAPYHATIHSRPLNSLEHCIFTTPMTKHPTRPGYELLSFEPQLLVDNRLLADQTNEMK